MIDPDVTSPPPSPAGGAAPVPEEALAAAVTGCRDVAALSGGHFGEVATYLAGRRVEGIRTQVDSIDVHVIARWGTPLPSIAEQVRSACAPFAEGRRVDVTIDDLVSIADGPTPGVGSPPIAPPTPHNPEA